jgi:hypothetical protein
VGNKRLFEITPDGSLALAANRTTVEAILARMTEVSEAQAGHATLDPDRTRDKAIAPQLRLALDDLKRAIEHRLAGDPLTKDQIGAILAALSTAASDVERA